MSELRRLRDGGSFYNMSKCVSRRTVVMPKQQVRIESGKWFGVVKRAEEGLLAFNRNNWNMVLNTLDEKTVDEFE